MLVSFLVRGLLPVIYAFLFFSSSTIS